MACHLTASGHYLNQCRLIMKVFWLWSVDFPYFLCHFLVRSALAFGYWRCLILSVRVCISHEFVHAICQHPFKLGSPNFSWNCWGVGDTPLHLRGGGGTHLQCFHYLVPYDDLGSQGYFGSLMWLWPSDMTNLGFLGIFWTMHFRNGLKFGMLVYTEHLQNWWDFGHGLSISSILSCLLHGSVPIRGVFFTKAPFVNFSVNKIFDLVKVPLRLFESRSYLTGVTAAELRRHLANINLLLNS